ncbi:MAG TPA: NADH-quinone oxidoreductase subunit I [Anaerolineae bacterium]|nr:NADH-quinone oxidoreductase subunit I [Anaerolineae bacterium]HPL27950.1 NADH-quinone oxidoreductase subunit I [Anaerolineae bacterium]
MLGTGLLKGLAVTFRHVVATYVKDLKSFPRRYRKEPVAGQDPSLRGFFTVQYPEERLRMFARFHGCLLQARDPETGDYKCTACRACERACPHGVIVVEGERNPDRESKKKMLVTKFTWDAGRCLFCGLCVEACNFDALRWSQDYELASYDRDALVYDFERLLEKRGA